MAQSYTRQSTFADGDTISASLFNNEYNQLVNSFAYSSTSAVNTGHRHDGTAGQGGNIFKIGDLDFLNKIEVDGTNNRLGFYVEVSSAAVEQVRIQDGAIVPVTDNDIDLGTSSLEFKDLYIDGTANLDSLVLGSGSTVTAILDEDDLSSDSATSLATQQSIKAYVDAQVTAQDFDFSADSGGALSIDLDSEAMTFTGGTGIDTSGSGNAVTFAIDSTVTTLTGSQTLTNKTLTAPTLTGTAVVASLDISGDVDIDGTLETDALSINSTTVTSTAAELNILDGVTSTAAELNILDGVTSTTAELNILDGVTATTAELNIMDGVTSTAAELNILDGKAFLDEDDMSSDSATGIASQQSIKAYVDAQITAEDLDFQADSGGALSIDLDSETLTFTGGTGVDTSGSGNAVTFAIDSTVATLTGTQTLTNKTLTSPTLNTPTIGTSFTIGSATITEAELEILDGATVTTDELNILDGVTATAAELNILDGVTSTAAELNILDGVTSTAAELNILDGVTSTAAELNILDGVTSTATELNIVDGSTSATSTTLADADRVVVNDNGTMVQVALTDFETYFESALDTLSNVTTVGTLGSLTVSGDVTVDTNTLKVDSSNNRVGILNASPDVSLDVGSATDAMHVPVGTTAQRPGSPAAGYFRYNSTTGGFEGYTDAWGAIAGGGGGVAPSIDTMTGDGSDTTLALTNAPVNENATFVTIDGVTQHKSTYSVSGTTLTFSTAPPTGSAVEAITLNTTTINTASILQDADGDTKVQVEESSDEDKIRFDTGGTERMIIDSTGVGIGTSPNASADLHVADTSDARIWLEATSGDTMELYAGTNVSLFNRSNNALTFGTNNTERLRITNAGAVGIGVSSPDGTLHVHTASAGTVAASSQADDLVIENSAEGGMTIITPDDQSARIRFTSPSTNNDVGGATIFYRQNINKMLVGTAVSGGKLALASGAGNETMLLDSSGNVGIGASTVDTKLHLEESGATSLFIKTENSAGALLVGCNASGNSFVSAQTSGKPLIFETQNSERARIDSSGNLLVGKTTTDIATAGTFIGVGGNVGLVEITRDNSAALKINRKTSDGSLVVLRRDNSDVGYIGTLNGSLYIASPTSTDSGLRFSGSTVHPCDTAGAPRDNAIDLGYASGRFDDIYATNGTIQTSDRNEKQDIEALTDAEQRVAVAVKGLLRKFRWKSSVEENGDDARIHFGIIAQDLQAAFTAEGLDAGRYAMFISSTWTDEDGNEQTRLGVRYSELLAFIISAI